MRKSTMILGGLLGLAVLIIIGLCVSQVILLRHAHSTYGNYYLFRGCVQQLERGSDYGYCKTADGQTIKIIELDNRWYLDGDLPACWHSICL